MGHPLCGSPSEGWATRQSQWLDTKTGAVLGFVIVSIAEFDSTEIVSNDN
jgi:hypothetical protein